MKFIANVLWIMIFGQTLLGEEREYHLISAVITLINREDFSQKAYAQSYFCHLGFTSHTVTNKPTKTIKTFSAFDG